MPGTCWNDPVNGQKACEPWVWTPGAMESFYKRTGANFRTIHAEVMACRDRLTGAEREQWARLYRRWQAFVESDPSMMWNATANTILGYVKSLQSWRQLLDEKGCERVQLKPTKQPPPDSPTDLLKWGAILIGVGTGAYVLTKVL